MAAVRVSGTSKAGTALPPLPDGTRALTMDEWKAQREARRRGWLARILTPRAASPVSPVGARPSPISAVEAGADKGGEGQ